MFARYEQVDIAQICRIAEGIIPGIGPKFRKPDGRKKEVSAERLDRFVDILWGDGDALNSGNRRTCMRNNRVKDCE